MSWITFDNLKRFWKNVRTNPITFTGEVDLQNTTKYKGKEIATKADVEAGGTSITVDNALSATSTNPVQNKVIKTELDKKWDTGSTTLTIHSNEAFPLQIPSTKDSRFSVVLGSAGLWISNDKGEVGLNHEMISFKNEDSSHTIISPQLDRVGTVQLLMQNTTGDITSAKNIATEDYVKTNYVPLSNGHISINGSELWVE